MNKTKVTINGQEFDFDAVVSLMDNDVRETIHSSFESDPTEQEFVDAYRAEHERVFGEEFIVN